MNQYNKNNIFAKILRKEIESHVVHENEHALVIKDLYPKAFIHNLVLPKGEYIDMRDFLHKASTEEKLAFLDAISRELNKISGGARIVINIGETGGQEVFHLHAHVMGMDTQDL